MYQVDIKQTIPYTTKYHQLTNSKTLSGGMHKLNRKRVWIYFLNCAHSSLSIGFHLNWVFSINNDNVILFSAHDMCPRPRSGTINPYVRRCSNLFQPDKQPVRICYLDHGQRFVRLDPCCRRRCRRLRYARVRRSDIGLGCAKRRGKVASLSKVVKGCAPGETRHCNLLISIRVFFVASTPLDSSLTRSGAVDYKTSKTLCMRWENKNKATKFTSRAL